MSSDWNRQKASWKGVRRISADDAATARRLLTDDPDLCRRVFNVAHFGHPVGHLSEQFGLPGGVILTILELGRIEVQTIIDP